MLLRELLKIISFSFYVVRIKIQFLVKVSANFLLLLLSNLVTKSIGIIRRGSHLAIEGTSQIKIFLQ